MIRAIPVSICDTSISGPIDSLRTYPPSGSPSHSFLTHFPDPVGQGCSLHMLRISAGRLKCLEKLLKLDLEKHQKLLKLCHCGDAPSTIFSMKPIDTPTSRRLHSPGARQRSHMVLQSASSLHILILFSLQLAEIPTSFGLRSAGCVANERE